MGNLTILKHIRYAYITSHGLITRKLFALISFPIYGTKKKRTKIAHHIHFIVKKINDLI